MTSPWLVSPFLADLLGPGVLAQLDDVDPRSALSCQVCGTVKPTGDPGPMAVVAAATDDGTLVIGLAHPACRDRVGDLWRGLLDRIGDQDSGIDSLALFALRLAPGPCAVLAFEPQVRGRSVLAAGDAVDHYLSAHLAHGFTLLREPIADLVAPVADGWLLNTRGGTITLAHDELGIGYTQETTGELLPWVRIARGEGRCLVVTGSGLNIDPTGPLPEDFTAARMRGTAAAATVRVR